MEERYKKTSSLQNKVNLHNNRINKRHRAKEEKRNYYITNFTPRTRILAMYCILNPGALERDRGIENFQVQDKDWERGLCPT